MKTALLLMLAGCVQIHAGVVALTILAEPGARGQTEWQQWLPAYSNDP